MENSSNCCTPCTPGCRGVMCVAKLLVIIGGLNWGLVGALDFNLVNYLVGQWPIVEKIVYIVVGVGALAMLGKLCMGKNCACKSKK